MPRHPTAAPLALLLSLAPNLALAESICDPGSFLSADLRARWCGGGAEPSAKPRKSARPRKQAPPAARKPQSQESAEPDEEQGPVAQPRREAPRASEPEGEPANPMAEPAAARPPARNEGVGCSMKQLRFSADSHPRVPASGEHVVWGGNATEGQQVLAPPYSSAFLARARQARANGIEVFAYLEGPCGDTGGRDDGERSRCQRLHNAYNARFAPGTPNTALARWKPYTLGQMKESGKHGIGYCEIDNLDNNVKVPLVPLMKELKKLFDEGKIYCRLVLKNLSTGDIDSIIRNVAPTPADAAFIAPFHIYEANGTGMKARLDAAMQRLKGSGSTTIISTDTNNYGARFTKSPFLTCGK